MASPFPKSFSLPGKGRVVARLLPTGKTEVETVAYQYPLKLISPPRSAHDKSVLVFLLSYGGGLVGGDGISLSVDVLPGARLCAVTQGHTKIFASERPDVVTRQALRVGVGDGAAFCLLPDPVQPFRDSVYEQVQVFELAPTASACLLDWVTRGRAARGENWSFTRWVGRNEVWSADPATRDTPSARARLLVRDSIILDADNGGVASPPRTLADSMHGLGVFGTLIVRGPTMRPLGEFFVREFAALPRVGARDFGQTGNVRDGEAATELEQWRAGRIASEKAGGVLWSAAQVRGCTVVKFGAPTVEAGRWWVGSMLLREGTVSGVFGGHALMCVR